MKYIIGNRKRSVFSILTFIVLCFSFMACQHEDAFELTLPTKNVPPVSKEIKALAPLKTLVFTVAKNKGLTKDVTATLNGFTLSADFTSAATSELNIRILKFKPTFIDGVYNFIYPSSDEALRNIAMDFRGNEITFNVLYNDYTTGKATYKINFTGLP